MIFTSYISVGLSVINHILKKNELWFQELKWLD